VDLWVRVLHVCVGTAACPGTAECRPCAPQAKIYRFVFMFIKNKLQGKFRDFLTIWWKAPFWLVENQKKDHKKRKRKRWKFRRFTPGGARGSLHAYNIIK
jgi:hypothetical protein